MSDLIDRQAVIDVIRKQESFPTEYDATLIDKSAVMTEIMMLHPAKQDYPEWVQMVERYYNKALCKEYIKDPLKWALIQTLMEYDDDDLISRQEAFSDMNESWCIDCSEYDQENHCCHRFSNVIRKTVKELQIERTEGKWKRIKSNIYECSVCGIRTNVDECMADPMYRWCPYCGANMRVDS